MMAPKEIDKLMAETIMEWRSDCGRWIDQDEKFTGYWHYSGEHQFSPTSDMNHAFMCLHKWLEGNPDRGYELMDTYWTDKNNNETVMLLYGENKHYHDHKPRGHEAQAICDCLSKAIKEGK